MPRLVATKKVRYAGKDRVVDDEFEASEKDAFLLIAIGKARAAEPMQAPKAVNLPREVMSRAPPVVAKVETAETTEETAQEPAAKRHYRRRDMSADQD